MSPAFAAPLALRRHAPPPQAATRDAPRCALSASAPLLRLAAASLTAAGCALRLHGVPVAGHVLGGCALGACVAGAALRHAPAKRRPRASKFASSRAMWDEEDVSASSSATSGGLRLQAAALGAARRLLADVLLPALDALRIALADLRAHGLGAPRASAYFTPVAPPGRAQAQRRHGAGLSDEERLVAEAARAAQQLGGAASDVAQRGARTATAKLRELLDGFR